MAARKPLLKRVQRSNGNMQCSPSRKKNEDQGGSGMVKRSTGKKTQTGLGSEQLTTKSAPRSGKQKGDSDGVRDRGNHWRRLSKGRNANQHPYQGNRRLEKGLPTSGKRESPERNPIEVCPKRGGPRGRRKLTDRRERKKQNLWRERRDKRSR